MQAEVAARQMRNLHSNIFLAEDNNEEIDCKFYFTDR